jgi:hypothetical protein
MIQIEMDLLIVQNMLKEDEQRNIDVSNVNASI